MLECPKPFTVLSLNGGPKYQYVAINQMKSDRSRPLAWHCEVTRQIPRVLFEENLMTWSEFIRQVCLDVDNLPLKLVFCLLIWLVLRTEFRQRAIDQVKVKVSVEEGLISNGHLLSLCSLQPSCDYIG